MIPKDPNMLLSYINTQLRDHYSSLEELASDLDISADEIRDRLQKAGYEYLEEFNRFGQR